jgi:threonine dehydrogenase-like Zn-dependent dehydrogenase
MKTMVLEVSLSRIALTRALAQVWRGAYFAPTSCLRLAQFPDPPLPAPDWVRVKNSMCGICGSDLHQLLVDADLDVAPVALPSHQRIYLGHEMIGTIAEAGAAVKNFRVGDRVVRWGRGDDCIARGLKNSCAACARGHRVLCENASDARTHALVGGGFGDAYLTPASVLLHVPDALRDEQAILIEPAAVALHAVSRRRPLPRERILVIGCGVIGFLVIQVLRAMQPDCEITALAEFEWQAELAREFGAAHTFLAREDGYQRVAELTEAKLYAPRANNKMLLGGFDVTLDIVGNPSTLNNALRWTRANGTVVLVGVNLHRMKLDVTPVWYQQVNLIGAVGHDVVTYDDQNISTFELAMQWMLSGKIKTEKLLTHRFPLDAYREAFRVALDKRNARSIKVAFEIKEKGK